MTRSTKHPVRLVVLLALVSLVSYALRTNISIAQEYLAPELGLSMKDMGTISAWGFQLAYALFQVPAGFLGDRFGARLVLGLALLGWAVASFASGLLPPAAGAAFFALFGARFFLGVTEAATYPVGAMAIYRHVPADRRATANGVFIAAALLGAALAPLTLAPLMVRAGWRPVFLASGVVALLMAVVWFGAAPPPPSREERGLMPPLGAQFRASLALLFDRDLMILGLAYVMEAAVFFVFVFWFFRYLVEGRGFSVLASGVWGSAPYFVAFLLGPLGGLAVDRLARRMPAGRARRRVAMGGLLTAAALVVIGANLSNAFLAVAALSLSVGCINATESPFWTTATIMGHRNPGAAGGVLNFMGNLGGIISIWAVPRMQEAWGWTALLLVWAGVAVLSALLWLALPRERLEREAPPRPA